MNRLIDQAEHDLNIVDWAIKLQLNQSICIYMPVLDKSLKKNYFFFLCSDSSSLNYYCIKSCVALL